MCRYLSWIMKSSQGEIWKGTSSRYRQIDVPLYRSPPSHAPAATTQEIRKKNRGRAKGSRVRGVLCTIKQTEREKKERDDRIREDAPRRGLLCSRPGAEGYAPQMQGHVLGIQSSAALTAEGEKQEAAGDTGELRRGHLHQPTLPLRLWQAHQSGQAFLCQLQPGGAGRSTCHHRRPLFHRTQCEYLHRLPQHHPAGEKHQGRMGKTRHHRS